MYVVVVRHMDDAGLIDEAGLMESWLSLLLDEGDFFPYH